MTSETIDINDEEAVIAASNRIQQRRAAEAKAALQERFAPLVALVGGDAFREVRDGFLAARDTLADMPAVAANLRTAARLLDMIAAQIPPDARPVST